MQVGALLVAWRTPRDPLESGIRAWAKEQRLD